MAPTDRDRDLERFVTLIASAAGRPWIDHMIGELVDAATAEPQRAHEHLAVMGYLIRARAISPPPSTPPADEAAAPSANAPNAAAEAEARKALERALVVDGPTMARGQFYEQLVICAGYAALIALWATMGPSLPRPGMLLSGAAIGLSSLLYVAFQLCTAIWSRTWRLEMVQAASAPNASWVERLAALGQCQEDRYRSHGRWLSAWRILLPLEVALAFVGAIGLVFAAVGSILG